MKTYQNLYQNENRPVKLTVYDENNIAFTIIDEAYYYVKDEDDTIIVEEQSASVDSNIVTAIIGTAVTAIQGRYEVVWKIIDTNGYIYYTKTLLNVMAI